MTELEDKASAIPSPPPGEDKFKVFLKRGISTLILISVLTGVYFLHNVWVYLVVFSAFCSIASWEWASMLKRARIGTPGWLVVGAGTLYPLVLGSSLILQGEYLLEPSSIMYLAPVLVTVTAFIWELRKPVEGRETFLSIGGSIVSFIYPVWMFSFALLYLIPFNYDAIYSVCPADEWGGVYDNMLDNSVMIFLSIFVLTKITDIGAYITGSLLGKHKMIPHISPGKTWEGFIGAIIITVACGYLLLAGFKRTWIDDCPDEFSFYVVYTLVLLAIALFSVVGDLAGSLIKRALGVKDSGKLLPGIGGVFDLIDSPAFTFPVFIIISRSIAFS